MTTEREAMIEALAQATCEDCLVPDAWAIMNKTERVAWVQNATEAFAVIEAAIEIAGYVVVPKEPTAQMLAMALPTASDPSHDDKKIGAAAVLLLSGGRVIPNEDAGVEAAAQMARDYRAMLAASPLAKGEK